MLYQSHLNDASRLHIRNLPLRADLFNRLFVQDLQNQTKIQQAVLCFCGNITAAGCYIVVPASSTKFTFIMCLAVLSGLLNLMRGGCSTAGELESSSSEATSALPTVDKPLAMRTFAEKPVEAGTPSPEKHRFCTQRNWSRRYNLDKFDKHTEEHKNPTPSGGLNPQGPRCLMAEDGGVAPGWVATGAANSRSLAAAPRFPARQTFRSKDCILRPVHCEEIAQ